MYSLAYHITIVIDIEAFPQISEHHRTIFLEFKVARHVLSVKTKHMKYISRLPEIHLSHV